MSGGWLARITGQETRDGWKIGRALGNVEGAQQAAKVLTRSAQAAASLGMSTAPALFVAALTQWRTVLETIEAYRKAWAETGREGLDAASVDAIEASARDMVRQLSGFNDSARTEGVEVN